MEETKASITNSSLSHLVLFPNSYASGPNRSTFIFTLLLISEKQQNGKVLSESLVETAAHDWADLGNAREIGARRSMPPYHWEMEANWGPDHITTVPEELCPARHSGGTVSLHQVPNYSWILCLPFDGSSLTSGCYLFQALHLLWLVTHLESRALDLKREALESLSIGVGGTKAAAIWDVIAGAFALRSEPVIHPFSDYSGKTPDKDPFDIMDPAPAIGCPLGYDVAAAPGYKPVDHIKAVLHHMQIGIPPVTSPDALGPLLIPDDPSNPASHTQVKATAAQQTCSKWSPCLCLSHGGHLGLPRQQRENVHHWNPSEIPL